MGRFRRRFEDYANVGNTDLRYAMAFKKMKRIKGFYVHLLVYAIFNTIIIFTNNQNATAAEFWRWNTFSLAFFWGIGLAAHAMSVFGRDLLFSKAWEERKIREFMEKTKEGKQQ